MENNIRKEFSLRIASKVFQFFYSFGGGAGKFLLRLHSEEDRLRILNTAVWAACLPDLALVRIRNFKNNNGPNCEWGIVVELSVCLCTGEMVPRRAVHCREKSAVENCFDCVNSGKFIYVSLNVVIRYE